MAETGCQARASVIIELWLRFFDRFPHHPRLEPQRNRMNWQDANHLQAWITYRRQQTCIISSAPKSRLPKYPGRSLHAPLLLSTPNHSRLNQRGLALLAAFVHVTVPWVLLVLNHHPALLPSRGIRIQGDAEVHHASPPPTSQALCESTSRKALTSTHSSSVVILIEIIKSYAIHSQNQSQAACTV